MLATILPPVLPDVSSSRGKIDKWHASRFISVVGDASCEIEPVPQLIYPFEGQMSGRAEGGKRHLLRGQTNAR